MGACRGRTASTGPSVRDPMWSADPRRGCVSASRNALKFWPTCRRIFTPSTAARRPDFPTSSSPSSGNCRFPSAFIYLQPAVWDFRPAAAKFRAAATILTFSSHGRGASPTIGHSRVCSPSPGSRASTPAIRPYTSNPTFEPTLSLERDLGPTRDLFVEYVGDYPNHVRPSQILDGGGPGRGARL